MRPAFYALWNLDLAFADVVSTSSDPRLGQIRLAWWRERLEELDRGGHVPAEPRLTAAAGGLLRLGVSGAELSRLENAWLPLLEPFPWSHRQASGLQLRGHLLFGVGARLLGGNPVEVQGAGALWSLIDGAQHCSDETSRNFLLSEARLMDVGRVVDRRLRPLTILTALALADARANSSGLARGLAAARHRITGQFPQR